MRTEFFIDPRGLNVERSLQLVRVALESIVTKTGKGPICDPLTRAFGNKTEIIANSEVPEKSADCIELILESLCEFTTRSVRAGHPFMLKNIIPTPSVAALVTHFAVSSLMGNGVTGEDSGDVLLAEIACASAIAKLAGFNPNTAGGIFTFGGTGTLLYAIKIGITKVAPDSARKGIPNDLFVIESKPSHYCHETACNWLGIGQDHCIRVPSNVDQTTCLDKLENACRDVLKQGGKIACIIANGGTTSNMAIDELDKIDIIRRNLQKEFALPTLLHLHVDAVLGASYLAFQSYDFDKNPMHFSAAVCQKLLLLNSRLSSLHLCDSFGVDFHKTGYMAYNSSMIMVKNRQDLESLKHDPKSTTPLFHDDSKYNPGKFTLETSRSSAAILSTWITLQTFGIEGYQCLLGHALEMGESIRAAVQPHRKIGLVVANKKSFGPDVFLRCYPPGIVNDMPLNVEDENSDQIQTFNSYTGRFFEFLSSEDSNWRTTVALSKSTAAFYTQKGEPVVALRSYPLSPYLSVESTRTFVELLARAKEQFDANDVKTDENKTSK